MTHKFKNVPMLLSGAMSFLVACQKNAMQEDVENQLKSSFSNNVFV